MDLYSTPLELLPLEGLRLGEQLLPLAASKEQAEALLGPAEEFQGDQWYYAESELRLDFDQSGRLEFIEFLGGLEGRLQPTIYGLPAFQTGAGELIEELTRRNNGPVDNHEQGYSYAFLNMMEENGIPTLDDPDVERDRRRAEHWETIGIGVAGYYQ